MDGANGLQDVSTLTDDSGPAPRLLSNSRVTLPSGFGADYAVGVFRNQSTTSAPEAPFFGGPVVPPIVGAQAGFYRINPSRLAWLEPRNAAIATQVRTNVNSPARGVEVAIPLASLFGSPATGNPGVNLLAFLGNTGEQDAFLSSVDPLRGTLGGRPAPNAWLSNQFLPTQPAVTGDPGANAVVTTTSVRYELTQSTDRTGQVAITSGALESLGNGRFRQRVTIVNGSASTLNGPVFLRVQVPVGVSVSNATLPSILVSGGAIELPGRAMPSLATAQVTVEYTSQDESLVTPTFALFSGRGVL